MSTQPKSKPPAFNNPITPEDVAAAREAIEKNMVAEFITGPDCKPWGYDWSTREGLTRDGRPRQDVKAKPSAA
jgi:hypothetical protein